MKADVETRKDSSITIYDPDKGLKTIAVSEASERHWARAKNAAMLLDAIETKIRAQAEYVVWRDGKVPPPSERGKRGGRGKKQITGLKSALPAADPGHVVAHRWRKRFCLKNGKRTEIDEKKLDQAFDDAAIQCIRVCEQQKTVRGTEGTGENEWFTPKQYIALARKVLGKIDLDPASSDEAQKLVKATNYFTSKNSGLELENEWHGRVWLNPPYAQPLISDFVSKMVREVRAGHVTAAIMLTHNYTDTVWFHEAVSACKAICFTRGRVQFYKSNGEIAAPTQGQAFFYFGKNTKTFRKHFNEVGFILVRP